jgi:hypothetical protein
LYLSFEDLELEPAHPSVFPQLTSKEIRQIIKGGEKVRRAFEAEINAERIILRQEYSATLGKLFPIHLDIRMSLTDKFPDDLELITDPGKARLPRYGEISPWFKFLIDRLPRAICPYNKE